MCANVRARNVAEKGHQMYVNRLVLALLAVCIMVGLNYVFAGKKARGNADIVFHSETGLSPDLCQDAVFEAARLLVVIKFPDERIEYVVQRVNEIRCERSVSRSKEDADMANILITVQRKNTGERYYAFAHIHFNEQGRPDDRVTPQWTPYQDDDEWRVEWCKFVRYVYPDELAFWKCTTA